MIWPFKRSREPDADKILKTLDRQRALAKEAAAVNEQVRQQVLDMARKKHLLGESLMGGGDASDS